MRADKTIKRPPRPWGEDEISEIGRLARAGASVVAIASKLDRSPEEIEWAAARHNIALRRPSPRTHAHGDR